jgi:hypothetical protein
MSDNKFPAGWDDERVRRILAHYEDQTDVGALIEDEAAIEPSENARLLKRRCSLKGAVFTFEIRAPP